MWMTINNTGDTYITLQYGGSSLNTATAIDSWLLQPNPEYPFFCYFNQSASASLVDGVTLTGATSTAVIKVGRVVLTQGSAASAGMGVLFFRYDVSNPVGKVILSGENLQVSSSTYCVAASGKLDAPLTPARALFLAVETNTIRYASGGVAPTNSTATPASFGIPIVSSSGIATYASIVGWKDVNSFQMLNAISGTLATVTVSVQF